MVNIGIVQTQTAPLMVTENLSQAEAAIAHVVKGGAQLVVLPEMFNVGFYFGEELMSVAESLDGPSANWLKEQAAHHNIYITGSFYERFDHDFYNTMVMAGSDGSLQYYRKRNPTCTERTVWRRCDSPGPGIFETPFGRIGGVICFDSFAQESFEGFRQSAVDLVVIVALWGTLRRLVFHPDTWLFHAILKRWSYLAAEVVPFQYATRLQVPTVFVNQGGATHFPMPRPRFWPLPSIKDISFDFWGGSNVRNRQGDILLQAGREDPEVYSVVSVDIPDEPQEKPPITRTDIALNYLSRDYYFVQPPLPAKIFQEWCTRGYKREYERRCLRQ